MKVKKKARKMMSKKKDKHIAYDDPNDWTYNYAAKQEKDDNEREEAVMSKKSANSTINWIKGAVICAVLLIFVVIFINLLTVRVPAGYAAVQYNMNGGVQDKSLGQGWHIKSPFVKTTLYTVGLEQSYLTASKKGDSPSDESFSASSSEGKAMTIELTYSYQFNQDTVNKVFTRFKGKSGTEVRDSFIKPNIVSWTKEVVAKYKVSDIIGSKKSTWLLPITLLTSLLIIISQSQMFHCQMWKWMRIQEKPLTQRLPHSRMLRHRQSRTRLTLTKQKLMLKPRLQLLRVMQMQKSLRRRQKLMRMRRLTVQLLTS